MNSRRTVPLPPDWHRIVPVILARDPVCRWGELPEEEGWCRSDSTEVDHMGAADDHRPEVLRGICSPCHARRTSRQANAAKVLRARMRVRPADNHPGYIRSAPVAGTVIDPEGTARAIEVDLCSTREAGGRAVQQAFLYAALVLLLVLPLLSMRRR